MNLDHGVVKKIEAALDEPTSSMFDQAHADVSTSHAHVHWLQMQFSAKLLWFCGQVQLNKVHLSSFGFYMTMILWNWLPKLRLWDIFFALSDHKPAWFSLHACFCVFDVWYEFRYSSSWSLTLTLSLSGRKLSKILWRRRWLTCHCHGTQRLEKRRRYCTRTFLRCLTLSSFQSWCVGSIHWSQHWIVYRGADVGKQFHDWPAAW